MTDLDLPTRLAAWAAEAGVHVATEREGWCDVCTQRMPCDWLAILEDVAEAATALRSVA